MNKKKWFFGCFWLNFFVLCSVFIEDPLQAVHLQAVGVSAEVLRLEEIENLKTPVGEVAAVLLLENEAITARNQDFTGVVMILYVNEMNFD